MLKFEVCIKCGFALCRECYLEAETHHCPECDDSPLYAFIRLTPVQLVGFKKLKGRTTHDGEAGCDAF